MDSSRNHIDDEGGRNNDGKMSHIDSKERWWVILITSGTISHIEIIKIVFMKFRGRIRVSWTVYNWLIRMQWSILIQKWSILIKKWSILNWKYSKKFEIFTHDIFRVQKHQFWWNCNFEMQKSIFEKIRKNSKG